MTDKIEVPRELLVCLAESARTAYRELDNPEHLELANRAEDLLRAPAKEAVNPAAHTDNDGEPLPRKNGWLAACDTEMINCCLGTAEADDSYVVARNKLYEIIDWHVSVALDPAVNGGKVLVAQDDLEAMRRDAERSRLKKLADTLTKMDQDGNKWISTVAAASMVWAALEPEKREG